VTTNLKESGGKGLSLRKEGHVGDVAKDTEAQLLYGTYPSKWRVYMNNNGM